MFNLFLFVNSQFPGIVNFDLTILDTTLCDKVCQCLAAGWWVSLGTLVSSTNKTDLHDITKILLKVALSTKKTEIKVSNNTI
jgi:hypothetical protein